ncbi:MAG TPA: hypothetical protein VIV82_08855, partial [Verrucomicrobiae bacterium]
MNCSKRNILTGALAAWFAGAALSSLAFTPMVPLTGLKILNLPAGIPGGNFGMTHLIDGNLKTEYASNDEGTNTVVELGFPKPMRITAVRHVDRNDNATVAVSELELFDANGQSVGKYSITHEKKRSGNTLFFLPSPVEASRAKWRVVQQGNRGLFSLGGAELTFFTSEPDDAVPSRDRIEVRMLPFVEKSGTRPVKVTIQHPYQETADVRVNLGDDTSKDVQLKSGDNVFEWNLSEVKTPTARKVEIQFQNQAIASADFQQSPARPMTIYIVPHSHTDIGYTEIQEAVAKKQVKNVADGIAAARRTANYPEGARF